MAGGRLTARLLLRVAGSAGEVAAAVGTRCRAQSASSSILTRSFAAGVAPLARCPGGDSETWTANRRLLRGDPARIDRLRWFGSVAPVELDDDDHDADLAAGSSSGGNDGGGSNDRGGDRPVVDVWTKELSPVARR